MKEVDEAKEYLESSPERVWVGKSGLTNTERDLFDTIKAQYGELKIYKKFTTQLCSMLLENTDENGYCTMTVGKDYVEELLESLPNHD